MPDKYKPRPLRPQSDGEDKLISTISTTSSHIRVGARALAIRIFGDDDPTSVRRTRHWAECGLIRTFKIRGSIASTDEMIAQDVAQLTLQS